MPKRGKVEIDVERCKGCYLCVISCPKKVLEKSSEFSKTGYYPAKYKGEGCIACLSCARVCPDLAIDVYEIE